MSTIALTDLAALAASVDKRTRIADPALRELAKRTVDARKVTAQRESDESSFAFFDYTPSQRESIAMLKAVHWPRMRALRNAIASADTSSREAHQRHDADALYDAVLRAHRLSVLAALIGRVSARVGAFGVSRKDQSALRSALLRNAAYRHFTFNGGRDIGSREFEPSDILQGAFIRAIDAGDVDANGTPTWGTMFGHIQAERAHLTRVANAEYHGMINAALGNVSHAIEEWPDMTDKHAVRRLDTYAGNGCMYPTLDQHRESIALAHQDAERAMIDDTVSTDARRDALDGAKEEFHVVLARVLIAGGTLEEVSTHLGLTVQTLKDAAIKSRMESLRNIDSRIDHSERTSHMLNMAEREQEVDAAQARHAATLRERRLAAETLHYAMGRAA